MIRLWPTNYTIWSFNRPSNERSVTLDRKPFNQIALEVREQTVENRYSQPCDNDCIVAWAVICANLWIQIEGKIDLFHLPKTGFIQEKLKSFAANMMRPPGRQPFGGSVFYKLRSHSSYDETLRSTSTMSGSGSRNPRSKKRSRSFGEGLSKQRVLSERRTAVNSRRQV